MQEHQVFGSLALCMVGLAGCAQLCSHCLQAAIGLSLPQLLRGHLLLHMEGHFQRSMSQATATACPTPPTIPACRASLWSSSPCSLPDKPISPWLLELPVDFHLDLSLRSFFPKGTLHSSCFHTSFCSQELVSFVASLPCHLYSSLVS